ncbi:class I SAM-dependent methyltransferase [Paractinoplanes ovalisporus]|uniref:class I SAM-dependent methyltransferase n=1 Tax=Paractinoplanes ovalisporus TaxID=2810368 RepID=UPI0027DE02B7|nr:class I SAM-dependent methyltransferase [Actinoplanes ovalisporus]
MHELALEVFGVDLSPGMIAVARRDHPHLRFEVGPMTSLSPRPPHSPVSWPGRR